VSLPSLLEQYPTRIPKGLDLQQRANVLMALINIVVVHHRLSPHAGMPIRMPANVNLEGMTLVERLFEGMILPHWNFDGATLTGSTLRKCQLSDCTFKAVDAPNVTFDQIEAKGLIDLTGARLVGGHFKDIVPAETFLYSRADLTAALFEGACWSATKENRFHNAILAACAGLPFGTSNENFDRVDLSALKLPGILDHKGAFFMDRKTRIEQVRRKIDKRSLIWVGSRSTDTVTLRDFNEFRGCFSYIRPESFTNDIVEFCLEKHKGRRVDVNRYDIDRDHSAEASMMRERLLRLLVSPSVIVPYCPSAFIGSVWFPRQGSAAYWGMFRLKQAAFEYKPWVESSLAENGIQTLPWRYYENGAVSDFLREAGDAPVVLRVNRVSGGAGLVLARAPSDVEKFCDDNEDGFFRLHHILRVEFRSQLAQWYFLMARSLPILLDFNLLVFPSARTGPLGSVAPISPRQSNFRSNA
jgi:hypothetical protein